MSAVAAAVAHTVTGMSRDHRKPAVAEELTQAGGVSTADRARPPSR